MDLKRDIFFFQFWGKIQYLSVGAGFVVKVCFYQVLWPEAEGKVTKLDQGQLLCSMSMSMSFSSVTKKFSRSQRVNSLFTQANARLGDILSRDNLHNFLFFYVFSTFQIKIF